VYKFKTPDCRFRKKNTERWLRKAKGKRKEAGIDNESVMKLQWWQRIELYSIDAVENKMMGMHLHNTLQTPSSLCELNTKTIMDLIGQLEKIIIGTISGKEMMNDFSGKGDVTNSLLMEILSWFSKMNDKTNLDMPKFELIKGQCYRRKLGET
jgi:hypothetical protein